MKRLLGVVVALALALAPIAPVGAEQDTLAKIKETGVLTIGTRTGSPPFAYVNKNNEWVGFSIDLVEMLVKPEVAKAAGKAIKIEKKESTPPTRIPLLTNNSVDLIAETMTDTAQRRRQHPGQRRDLQGGDDALEQPAPGLAAPEHAPLELIVHARPAREAICRSASRGTFSPAASSGTARRLSARTTSRRSRNTSPTRSRA